MATKKVSELPGSTTINAGDEFLITQGGVSKKGTIDKIEHGHLANPQGGTTNEHFHLTQNQHDAIADTVDLMPIRQEATGYENMSDSVMSFDNATRTFTIQPVLTSYSYWIEGRKYSESASKQVVISDSVGLHYIYFDVTQTLIADPAPPTTELLKGVAFTAIIYWDSANGKAILIGEERHGLVMDWATHNYLHFSHGSQYTSGLAIADMIIDGNGSIDDHCQLSVSDGTFKDEDIEINITNNSPQSLLPTAQLPVFYRSGANGDWTRKEADNYPFIYSGDGSGYIGASGLVAYNEWTGTLWQLSEANNNSYTLIHVLATNDISTPVVSVLGNTVYSTKADAREGATTELKGMSGLPFVEFVEIGTVILQTKTGFTNSTKAVFVSTDLGQSYVDFRDLKVLSAGSGTNDHGNLSGLIDDDHNQYLNLNGRSGQDINDSIGVGTNGIDSSAALQIESTTKGFLPPRMTTTERNAVTSPATGLMIYNTTTNSIDFFNGSVWSSLSTL